MKKIWLYIFFGMILFGACNSGNSIHIYDLRCEHLVDPLGIDSETPRFSWKISDPAADRKQRQTAYRILVASSSDKLKPGKADVWDSQVVTSGDSHLIPYGGTKLKSGTGYYWKVVVYGNENKASAWSATARFSMGLPDRSDWKGVWIKHPDASPERHIWFRRKMNISDHIESAYVHVASIGYHELYINGRKVDERTLAPALARLDKRVLYVTYDIAPLLAKGDNIIALWYAPGWSRYNFFAPSVEQAFLLQLNGKTKKGESFTLHSDNSWKCAESYSSNSGGFQILDMGGEIVDGRRYSDKWNTLAFDDSDWLSPVQVVPLKQGGEPVLSAQMTDITRIIETVSAKRFIDTVPGIWKVDMGKNFTGFVEASFSGLREGDTIVIKTADRDDVLDEYGQKSIYIARGEDGETFCNRFNFSAGRYIHFIGLNKPPELSAVKGHAISSAAKRTGYFECSDSLRPAALKHLEDDMTGAHPYFDIGSTSRYPYFKTLFAYPQFHEIISTILSRTDSPGYGYLLSQGETTWPEVWEANERTHFHTSYTGISAWFIKGLAGIEPDIAGPGYRTFNIRPNVVEKLSYAKAALESPYGTIESGWRKENGRVIYDITIPAGSKANIYLPATASQIREDEQPLENVQGITVIDEHNGGVLFLAEAGKYTLIVAD
jgi:hypothetical protein